MRILWVQFEVRIVDQMWLLSQLDSSRVSGLQIYLEVTFHLSHVLRAKTHQTGRGFREIQVLITFVFFNCLKTKTEHSRNWVSVFLKIWQIEENVLPSIQPVMLRLLTKLKMLLLSHPLALSAESMFDYTTLVCNNENNDRSERL